MEKPGFLSEEPGFLFGEWFANRKGQPANRSTVFANRMGKPAIRNVEPANRVPDPPNSSFVNKILQLAGHF
ncbi:hypothetical protein H0178_12745 [Cytobacillus firmus]|nr:hypothetical protein [Cytobacillus firmus]